VEQEEEETEAEDDPGRHLNRLLSLECQQCAVVLVVQWGGCLIGMLMAGTAG